MADVIVEIRGAIELENGLIKLGEDMARKTMIRAGIAGGRVLKNGLAITTPKHTGLLSQNIYAITKATDGGFTETKVGYRAKKRGLYKGGFIAQILTSGRKRASRKNKGFILARTKKVLADVTSGKVFGKKAKPKNIAPMPFVEVAFEGWRELAVEAHNAEIEKAIDKFNRS